MKSINRKVRNINNTLGEQATRIANIEQCLRNWTPKEGIVTPRVEDSKEEFRKQLHQLHYQAKKMKRQYRLLATPLKIILSSSLKVPQNSGYPILRTFSPPWDIMD